MKIGIFGDGYAALEFTGPGDIIPTWPHDLEKHGHECTIYGRNGTSIWYSVRLLKKHAAEHDFLIWCVTMPGRLTISTKEVAPPDNIVNYRWLENPNTQFKDARRLQEIFRDYYLNLVDIEEDNLLWGSLVHRLMALYPNLMVIPCFPPPLKMPFNLWDLCCYEIRPCFADQQQWRHWNKYYRDGRANHLLRENHVRLAREIHDNLRPGIFQTTYDKFVQTSDIGTLIPRPQASSVGP